MFLAADKVRLQDLDEALRKYLAWASIIEEKETLDLSPFQLRQAETQKQAADGAVKARLPETYQWLLVPEQKSPQVPVEWHAVRITGADALAVRASKKLNNYDLLVANLGATILRKHLDDVPLWRGDHVSIAQLAEDFARYLYLSRLKNTGVLIEAIRSGLGLLTWSQDSFAYAESFDEAAGRYRGLQTARQIAIDVNNPLGLLVKAEGAQEQLAAETSSTTSDTTTGPSSGTIGETSSPSTTPPAVAPGSPQPAAAPTGPKRFHGTVTLDSTRVGRDAGRIGDEVISHLAGIVGAQVRITLEIEAKIPSGAPEHVVRTVTENCRTLKFDSQGFEME